MTNSAEDVFSADALRVGQLLARPAAVLLHDAQALVNAQRLTEQLQDAPTS